MINVFFVLFIDINECASQPCLNGGACTDGVNEYTCNCLAGWTGVNCGTGMGLQYLP